MVSRRLFYAKTVYAVKKLLLSQTVETQSNNGYAVKQKMRSQKVDTYSQNVSTQSKGFAQSKWIRSQTVYTTWRSQEVDAQ